MFQKVYGEVVVLCPLGEEERRNFFSDLLLVQAARPPPRLRSTGACSAFFLPQDEAVRIVTAVSPRMLCCLSRL